ncbi:uncharacterized protein LOC123307222 [Coccinella septempunctata]|uniref:uncharacterized protein LOC123307222 n=1 Tax=Coccinella septempunctata TaxID=41139 RepID=UPI001D0720CF|nr:uncharacterized protein LOC123307222 [Coccinella septempunctata]
MAEQNQNVEQEEEVEAYCSDSVDDVPIEIGEKRSSLDEHILRLTSDIMEEKTFTLEQASFQGKGNFQDRVDIIISQMREISQFINLKCGMIDKMNILMCILTFKIFDIQHKFNVKLDLLKAQRENIILSKDDENMIPIDLLELDREMRELQYRHHERSRGYKQQKIEMQIEYEKINGTLDQHLDILKGHLKMLKDEHENFLADTKRAEPLLIDYIIQSAVEEFSVVIEQFEGKQIKGWKSLEGDEEMLDNLQSRGLAVSKSGYILTEGGERLSYDEAEKRQLLEGLDFRSRIFSPAEQQANEDIVGTPSSVQTIEETEKESLGSQISSEDVSYLKDTLGKPLTLAIAEITAKQPRDPIHYLGHWLFKYRYNQELDVTQKQEYEALMLERNRLLKEKLQRLYEEEAKLVIFEMINNAENEAIRKELERILREQVMGGEDEENDQATKEYEELKKLLKMIQKTSENR